MEVFAVIQPSYQYDFPSENLCCICETMEKAQQMKEKLDKMVVFDSNLWTIVPEDIYNEWPHKCVDSENDIWEPDGDYKGYTIDDFNQQVERCELRIMDYDYAEIRSFILI